MKRMDEKTARNPTTQEFDLLKHYYTNIGYDDNSVDKIVQNSWFAVFDCGDSRPSVYRGNLIVAIYDMIEFYEIFHLENNILQRILFHRLTLEQSMQLTSILHTAVTMRLQQLGYMKRPGHGRSKG
jgi:hypothetical protein